MGIIDNKGCKSKRGKEGRRKEKGWSFGGGKQKIVQMIGYHTVAVWPSD